MRSPAVLIVALAGSFAPAAERIDLDEGWRYLVGEAAGAEAAGFDDRAWCPVDLPHDAALEFPPDAGAPSKGGGGYFRSGVLWYRRSFELDATKLRPQPPDARLRLEFDGATRHAQVWLNGERLGAHAYDYTPFTFDVTSKVRYDAPNVLAVKIDSSAQPASRWHAGWGITRHVELRVAGPIALAPHSLWSHTEDLTDGRSRVAVRFAVRSDAAEAVPLRASVTAFDGQQQVASESVLIGPVTAGETTAEVAVEVPRPKAWSPDSPQLYELRVELSAVTPGGDRVIDSAIQRVGLRTVKLDPEQGFLLNGSPIKLFGGNVHHDNGPLGAAAFDDADRRRVRLLKEAGFNAIRTSHNPPSEAFLDACDAEGLLVIDEAFDGWCKSKIDQDYGDQFDGLWRDELTAMVRRDRRHPSVVMWSIGNEVYERGEASGVRYAHELSGLVRSLDPTRPVTAGICGLAAPADWPKLDPLFEPLDVCGYNYETARYGPDHGRLPKRLMYGSETYPVDVLASWRAVTTQPWVVGDFVWTAMDYLGEAGIGRPFPPSEEPKKHWEGEMWPWRGAGCGDIDLIGHRKPISHYRNLVWNRGETLGLSVVEPTSGDWRLTPWSFEPEQASWTWNVPEGEALKVVVASRWPRVRLDLNGRAVGEAATTEAEAFRAVLRVPYEPGELVAVALDDTGQEAERTSLVTAGAAASIALEADRTTAPADRQRLVFIDVALIDAKGRVQTRADRLVRFGVEGAAALQAVGSGDLTCHALYAGDEFPSHHGRLLAVLRSTGKPGRATLVAHAEGLPDQRLEVEFLPQ